MPAIIDGTITVNLRDAQHPVGAGPLPHLSAAGDGRDGIRLHVLPRQTAVARRTGLLDRLRSGYLPSAGMGFTLAFLYSGRASVPRRYAAHLPEWVPYDRIGSGFAALVIARSAGASSCACTAVDCASRKEARHETRGIAASVLVTAARQQPAVVRHRWLCRLHQRNARARRYCASPGRCRRHCWKTRMAALFRLQDYRGKLLAVEFIYTRCVTICRTLGAGFRQIRDNIPQQAWNATSPCSASASTRRTTRRSAEGVCPPLRCRRQRVAHRAGAQRSRSKSHAGCIRHRRDSGRSRRLRAQRRHPPVRSGRAAGAHQPTIEEPLPFAKQVWQWL